MLSALLGEIEGGEGKRGEEKGRGAISLQRDRVVFELPFAVSHGELPFLQSLIAVPQLPFPTLIAVPQSHIAVPPILSLPFPNLSLPFPNPSSLILLIAVPPIPHCRFPNPFIAVPPFPFSQLPVFPQSLIAVLPQSSCPPIPPCRSPNPPFRFQSPLPSPIPIAVSQSLIAVPQSLIAVPPIPPCPQSLIAVPPICVPNPSLPFPQPNPPLPFPQSLRSPIPPCRSPQSLIAVPPILIAVPNPHCRSPIPLPFLQSLIAVPNPSLPFLQSLIAVPQSLLPFPQSLIAVPPNPPIPPLPFPNLSLPFPQSLLAVPPIPSRSLRGFRSRPNSISSRYPFLPKGFSSALAIASLCSLHQKSSVGLACFRSAAFVHVADGSLQQIIRVILLSVFTHNPGKDGGSRSFDVLEGPLASQGSSSPSLNRHSRGLYLLRCQWSAGPALVICRSIDSVRNWIDSSSLPERGGDLLRS
ncbi:hypothetical protein C7M84_005736 [Penaeus vannamei]|uniref:Uncharacterized protein n=1 Tax=Penaeus vannamei TaxID=6689 RepID=A0A3R7SUJ0_PENVA|nr:hypothetical protein C7M84_005736 [Penaeus vannamei]